VLLLHDAWGWRVPFLLGLLVGIAGFLIRRYVLADVHSTAAPVS